MLERQTNMYMNEMKYQDFRNFISATKASVKVTNVIGWYQERKLQFSILARFATMIFDILPSQAKNERDFYLSGVFTRS